MSRYLISLATLASLAAVTVGTAAEASRGRVVGVRGPDGRGAVAHRSIDRDVGSSSVSRGIHGSEGRGVHSQRDRSWGDGTYNGSASRELNDGRTASRNVNATANGDGTASYSASRTGFDGTTKSKSGTVGTPR